MTADQHIGGHVSMSRIFVFTWTQQDVFSAAQKDLSIPKSTCPCRGRAASPKSGNLSRPPVGISKAAAYVVTPLNPK